MTIGAVGAAVIAGIVSVIGLVLGKENKVSEFRQAWIEELRKSLVSYITNINAVADIVKTLKAENKVDYPSLVSHYKALNEATTNIKLRINENEQVAKDLLAAMDEFDQLARCNDDLTPANVRPIETKFLSASKTLLKFEWNRVKRGETAFVVTKYGSIAALILLIGMLIWSWKYSDVRVVNQNPNLHLLSLAVKEN